MHYCAYVMLPPGVVDVEEAVATLMDPYNEQDHLVLVDDPRYPEESPYETNPRSFWDWWQLGGRWTGYLSDYDPHTDPANMEPCDHYGHGLPCNQCESTGLRLKWPTEWVAVDKDLIPAKVVADWLEIDPTKFPYTFLAGERVLHREVHNPEWRPGQGEDGKSDYSNYMIDTPDFQASVIESLRRAPEGCMVVIVDYHS